MTTLTMVTDFDQVFEVVLRERLVLIDPDMPAPVAGEVVSKRCE
ncbi:MAG: hypothetical protein ACLS36_05470 [Streptococcus sp.]